MSELKKIRWTNPLKHPETKISNLDCRTSHSSEFTVKSRTGLASVTLPPGSCGWGPTVCSWAQRGWWPSCPWLCFSSWALTCTWCRWIPPHGSSCLDTESLTSSTAVWTKTHLTTEPCAISGVSSAFGNQWFGSTCISSKPTIPFNSFGVTTAVTNNQLHGSWCFGWNCS